MHVVLACPFLNFLPTNICLQFLQVMFKPKDEHTEYKSANNSYYLIAFCRLTIIISN